MKPTKLNTYKLRVIATKNQRNRGHGRKIDFAHTLPV